MYTLLGILAASLVVIAGLPLLWRRAQRLARARLEREMPVTQTQIRAEKDQIRAHHAVEIRRLEAQIEGLQEQASSQRIRAERARSRLHNAAEERDTFAQQSAVATSRESELQEQLDTFNEDLDRTMDELSDTLTEVDRKQAQLQDSEQQLEQARKDLEDRQTRLTAQETRLHALEGDLAEIQSSRSSAAAEIAEMEIRLRHTESENQVERDSIEELRLANEMLRSEISEFQMFGPADGKAKKSAKKKRRQPADPSAAERELVKLKAQLEDAQQELAGKRHRETEEYLALRNQLDALASQITGATEKSGGSPNLIDQLLLDVEALKSADDDSHTDDIDEELGLEETDFENDTEGNGEADQKDELSPDNPADFPRPPSRGDRIRLGRAEADEVDPF